jgi:predicted GNAT family N-acyltransferase
MTQEPALEVRNHLSSSQVDDLLRLYGSEWWSSERTRADVERMLLGSDLLCAIIERESDSLAAFARVLTDRVYTALVLDVIVDQQYRGRGLGRLLVDRICAEPALRDVASIELVCQPELMPFYRKWGFSERVGRSRLMRRTSSPLLSDDAAQRAAAQRAAAQRAAAQRAAAADTGGAER